MGIVSGFVDGAAQAAAKAGEYYLVDKIKGERAEADALRNAALKKEERLETQEWESAEAEKRDEAAMARTKYTTDNKPAKNPQLIKYTDSKGYEHEGILQKNQDGTFTIVKPGTGEVMEDSITREELKNKAAEMNVSEGRSDDWIPFNEYDIDDPEVRAAVAKDKKGIVNSASNVDIDRETPETKMPPPEPANPKRIEAPQAALDYLDKNPEALPQFIEKYGYDPTKK